MTVTSTAQLDELHFRKKPVVITARQTTAREEIVTLEGTMVADPGDWIITGVKGECYPCKPDIFAMTYEPVQRTEKSPPARIEDTAESAPAEEGVRGQYTGRGSVPCRICKAKFPGADVARSVYGDLCKPCWINENGPLVEFNATEQPAESAPTSEDALAIEVVELRAEVFRWKNEYVPKLLAASQALEVTARAEGEQAGYLRALEEAVQITMDADCCCRCQDDIYELIKKAQA